MALSPSHLTQIPAFRRLTSIRAANDLSFGRAPTLPGTSGGGTDPAHCSEAAHRPGLPSRPTLRRTPPSCAQALPSEHAASDLAPASCRRLSGTTRMVGDGRWVISGRMVDVCAELDRLTQQERLHARC